MATNANYLLGNGERLTGEHPLKRSSRDKNPPYTLRQAIERLSGQLAIVSNWADGLPDLACPKEEVVAEVTLHPRYIAKTEQPLALLARLNLRPIGRRPIEVQPDQWGVEKHPERALSDKLFVAGQRSAFRSWAQSLPHWSENTPDAAHLAKIERIEPFTAEKKLIDVPGDDAFVAELVLHNDGHPRVLEELEKFTRDLQVRLDVDRRKVAGRLTFVPAQIAHGDAESLAEFSLLRVLRTMPRLRAIADAPATTIKAKVALPQGGAASDATRTVIFDGGVPDEAMAALSPWVTRIEPPGIAAPHAGYQQHGLAVTSAFLFGPLKKGKASQRPPCMVDHVRVLDANTGSDYEYYDVLERITGHLDAHREKYRFASLSLGPQRAITDDEVTAWTAVLDQQLALGGLVLAVAAGNDGELDESIGLNRIQPPSDGVNALSVGSADSRGKKWGRASYSCIGPGRCPGVFKPDGLSFGGTDARPFEVLGPGVVPIGQTGTSLSAPFALHTVAAADALLERRLDPLTLRALMVHRAEKRQLQHKYIGWGRFLESADKLVRCEDDEAVVVYQEVLPLRVNMRAPLALPHGAIHGKVHVTATLAICPDVDPEHVSTYTRGGLQVMFRPDADHFEDDEHGFPRKEPATADFFGTQRLTGRVPEYLGRKDAHKWEPVLRATRSFEGVTLNRPFFDIYAWDRERGLPSSDPLPLRYALIVSVKAPSVPDFYQRVLAAHAKTLVPLAPSVHVHLAA